VRFDAFTAGGSNTLASIGAASERTVNWYPEQITGNAEKGPMALTRTPGLSLWATALQSPIRGLWPGENRLFVAAGTNLYEALATSTGTFWQWKDHGNIGNDGKPVQMFANGGQLFVVSAGNAYVDTGSGVEQCQFSVQLTDLVIDASTGKLTAGTGGPFVASDVGKTVVISSGTGFTGGSNVITAVDTTPGSVTFGAATGTTSWGTAGSSGGMGIEWLGTYVTASQGAFLDTYFFAAAPNSKTIYFSAPGDGTMWNPLDKFDKETYPDNVAAMVADHEQLYVFGDLQASEVFQDQGATNPLVPWAPNPGAIMHYGCVAPWSVCRLGEGLAWIGGDVERGDRVAFLEVGFRPQQISTAAVETAWASYATVEDAIGYTCIDRGHQFWILNFPTANATWEYDLKTGIWAERGAWTGSYDAHGFPTWNMQLQQFHAVVAFTITERHYVAGLASGKLYIQSDSYLDDAGTAIYRIRRCPHMTQENLWRFYGQFKIDCDILGKNLVYWNRLGKGKDRIWQLVSWQTASTGVSMYLCFSDDCGQSWIAMPTITLPVGVDATLSNAYIEDIQGNP
jgi:hypothetical protein